MKRLIYAVPILALVVLVIFGGVRLVQGNGDRADLFTGKERPAPMLELATPDGGVLKLADFRGEPILVNLWATWCGPCELEHPILMDMAAAGAPIVGILYKDDMQAGVAALAEQGNPYTAGFGLDPDGSAGLDMGINSVPETFLINAQGMIVVQNRGPVTPEKAAQLFEAWMTLKANETALPASDADGPASDGSSG